MNILGAKVCLLGNKQGWEKLIYVLRLYSYKQSLWEGTHYFWTMEEDINNGKKLSRKTILRKREELKSTLN